MLRAGLPRACRAQRFQFLVKLHVPWFFSNWQCLVGIIRIRSPAERNVVLLKIVEQTKFNSVGAHQNTIIEQEQEYSGTKHGMGLQLLRVSPRLSSLPGQHETILDVSA